MKTSLREPPPAYRLTLPLLGELPPEAAAAKPCELGEDDLAELVVDRHGAPIPCLCLTFSISRST